MKQVCVLNAEVKITAPDGQVLIKQIDKIPKGVEKKLKVGGKNVLVKKDIENWLATFITNYDFSAFKGGMIKPDLLTKIEPLSEKLLTPNGKAILLNTKIEILAKASVPGVDPPGVSDSASQGKVILKVEFTSTGQGKLSAV